MSEPLTFTRVLRGPSPPTGVAYKSGRQWRCWLGLHRWAEVWEFTTTRAVDEERPDGSIYHERAMSLRLDREPDYIACQWCREQAHEVREPKL